MKTSGSIRAVSMAIIICLLGTIYCSVVLALDNKHEYVNINNEVLQAENLISNQEKILTPEPEKLKVEVNILRKGFPKVQLLS